MTDDWEREPEPAPIPSHWDFRWLQPKRNALCCGLAVLPLGWWRHVLHLCAAQQSPQAAFGLSAIALITTLALDHYRRARWTRTLLWLAVLGLTTTPAALTGALAILTGANL